MNKSKLLTGIVMFGIAMAVLFLGVHKDVSAAGTTWQCMNCGQRVYCGGGGPPSSTYFCGGDSNRRHVWQRIK